MAKEREESEERGEDRLTSGIIQFALRASHLFVALNSLNVPGVIRRLYKAFHARCARFAREEKTVERYRRGKTGNDIRAHSERLPSRSCNYMDTSPVLVSSIVRPRSRQRRPFASWKTRDRPTRTTAGDRVPKKFRRRESAPATNSSRGRAFVFTSRAALFSRNYVPRELNARQLLGGRR